MESPDAKSGEQVLEDVAERGRSDSGLRIDAQEFAAHLRQLHPEVSAEAAATLRAGELALAFACATGDRDALQRFEREYGEDIDRIVRRGVRDHSAAADVAQQARLKILFPAKTGGGAPRIAGFRGQGPLRAWIRVVCSRMAVDEYHRARDKPAVDGSISNVIEQVDFDPTTQWLRDRYRDVVKAAMEAAFEGLSGKDRRLLRGFLVQRLSTESLGLRFGVHRTTAARWVSDARRRLLERTQEELRERIGPERDDALRSVIALVRSTIDLSVARLLESKHAEPR